MRTLAVLVGLWFAAAAHAAPLTRTLAVDGGHILLTVDSGARATTDAEIVRWVETSAKAVIAYFGRFPVPELALRVRIAGGSRIGSAVTYGWPGPRIEITIGSETRADRLGHDWKLVHEMTHTGFPSVPAAHHWIEEGFATYAEPIGRIRIGQLKPESVWGELARDMPQGQPEPGDRGLDRTPTWGRTYWGGALFCLVADVRIRKTTRNRMGLEHAVRGIVAAGGTITEDWPLARALAAGDRATGTTVLTDLHREMGSNSVTVDLDALWTSLGVRRTGRGAELDDTAPDAAVRRAITWGR